MYNMLLNSCLLGTCIELHSVKECLNLRNNPTMIKYPKPIQLQPLAYLLQVRVAQRAHPHLVQDGAWLHGQAHHLLEGEHEAHQGVA